MTASTSFSDSGSEATGARIYYGSSSSSKSFRITRANCLISISSTSGTYGDITTTYVLTNDRATNCSMRPYYSIDGGTNFSEGTKGTDGDAKTGLTTSVAGTSHTFVWDTYTDIGNDYVGDIMFKIRVYDNDTYIGDYLDSPLVNISVNNAPYAPDLTTPTDGYFQKDDTPQFVGEIPDDPNPAATYSKVHVKLEVDTVNDFNSSDFRVFESRVDQVGWEYQNASDVWVAVPTAGIQLAANIIGKGIRFTLPTEDRLPRTTLYWRMVFGGIVT